MPERAGRVPHEKKPEEVSNLAAATRRPVAQEALGRR